MYFEIVDVVVCHDADSVSASGCVASDISFLVVSEPLCSMCQLLLVHVWFQDAVDVGCFGRLSCLPVPALPGRFWLACIFRIGLIWRMIRPCDGSVVWLGLLKCSIFSDTTNTHQVRIRECFLD